MKFSVKDAPCVEVKLVVRLYSFGEPVGRQPGEYSIWVSPSSTIKVLVLISLYDVRQSWKMIVSPDNHL